MSSTGLIASLKVLPLVFIPMPSHNQLYVGWGIGELLGERSGRTQPGVCPAHAQVPGRGQPA